MRFDTDSASGVAEPTPILVRLDVDSVQARRACRSSTVAIRLSSETDSARAVPRCFPGRVQMRFGLGAVST